MYYYLKSSVSLWSIFFKNHYKDRIRKKLTTKRLNKSEALPIATWTVQQWRDGQLTEQEDRIVMEEPFEVRVNGRSLAAIMRTPGLQTDQELAMGFLLAEGIITNPAQVRAIVRAKDKDGLPEENVLDVLMDTLPPGLFDDKADEGGRFERRFTVASSCGLCGKNSIEEVCRRIPSLPADNFKVSAQAIYSMPDSLRQAQAVFERTGGLHGAGLFTAEGQLLLLREDIGRHNAVDKLIGRMALDGHFPLPGYVLLVSGRVSFEIVQKALAAQIPVIAAVSAPSSLALELAEETGISLIGFLRDHHMNVYTHGYRIIG